MEEGQRNDPLQHYNVWKDLPGQRHGKLFIGRPCKRRADDHLLKLNRHQLRTAVAVLTDTLLWGGTCILWACLMGIQLADFAGWRLKQCNILFAAVKHWHVSAIMFLGSCLLNQKL
jgi:hypothetical protein